MSDSNATSDWLLRLNREALRYKGRSEKHRRRLVELRARTRHQLRQIDRELPTVTTT